MYILLYILHIYILLYILYIYILYILYITQIKNKACIKNLKLVRCQQPDWWEPETSDALRNPKPIDLVEVRPSPTVSVRYAVQHTQQTLQFPAKEKDNSCEQTVPKAEASENATCNTQQQNINCLGALPDDPPSMILRTNFVSQPGV